VDDMPLTLLTHSQRRQQVINVHVVAF